MANKMINVLVVDDSAVFSTLLGAILEAESDFKVVGYARDGKECVRMAHKLSPDLITMDIRMPVMDGVEATRVIMSTMPTPVVVVSNNVETDEQRLAFRAIEEGALAAFEKPLGYSDPNFEQANQGFTESLRAMAGVPVFRRGLPLSADVNIIKQDFSRELSDIQTKAETETETKDETETGYELLAIGSSVGGPQALRNILSRLPRDFPVPIVVVQHLASGFLDGLCSWLQVNIDLDVEITKDKGRLEAGVIYLAKDDYHLEVKSRNEGDERVLYASLDASPPKNSSRPSVDVLFSSIAATCGSRAAVTLLTGMGTDGSEGMREVLLAGGHTFVQDENSSVVWGMAKVAVDTGAAKKVVGLEDMPNYLTCLMSR